MKKLMGWLAVAGVMLLAQSAFAEDWYLKANIASGGTDPFGTQASTYWANSEGVAASAIVATDECHIEGGKEYKLYATKTFPGAKLHLGAVDGSTAGLITHRQYSLTCKDLRWHNGKFSTNYGKRQMHVYGAMTLDCATKNHEIAAGSDGNIFYIDAALSCEETDLVLKVTTAKTNFLVPFGGDNAGFKGRISHQGGTTTVIAGHANALGDPQTARANALSIDADNSVFAVKNGVTPNAARGIQINRAGFKVRADNISYNGGSDASSWSYNCLAYELPMPISGSYGFTKTGVGTVTLSGEYTATGAIVVSAGTLVIASSADLPPAQAITVKAGATLIAHQSLKNFTITAEDGATVERVTDTLTVAYDPDMKTVTTPVHSSFAVEEGVAQTVILSQKIAVPCHDALRLEVLRVTRGTQDLTAADFEDQTEKTYGLPKTSFEVVKDGDGVQHVYLNVRPVVKSVAAIGNVGINGVASSWSDAATPHEDADYLLVHNVGDVQKFAFKGDSLTIAGNASLQFRASDASGNNHSLSLVTGRPVVVYPGVGTTQGYNGREFPLSGNIYLVGEYGDTGVFDYYLKYGEDLSNKGQLDLRATLHGSGTLRVRGATNGRSVSGLTGDNSDYFGRIILHGSDTTDERKGVQVRVNKASSFGGRLDEFKFDALTLSTYAMIQATADVSLTEDLNRGILIGNGGFNCDAGKTFKTTWPISLKDTMYKRGAGTLILGGALTHDTSSTHRLIVRGGSIGFLSDAAANELTVKATNDFTVVMSPAATLTNGFAGLDLSPVNATAEMPQVHVVLDAATAEQGQHYTLPICTLPADSTVTKDTFVVDRVKGFASTVVSETLSDGRVRYSLDCTQAGLIVIMK